ncbi:Creatine kinase [Diplonema papillatum]|nr:Creatine kinase [Diplonema papillatum]KAJ9441877.1 Creatine kinase [Diplonema papillatum]
MLAKPASEADRISGLVRDWPDARGLFVSAAKDLFVWVNGRHHVQVISRETGGDLGQALQRLVAATESIENSFGGVTRYLWDPSHGYLGHDLSEIGNAIALEATVRLPHFGSHAEFLKHIKSLNLYAIPHEDEKDGIWRLVMHPSFNTEVDQAQAFSKALYNLLDHEEAVASTGRVPI